MKHFTFFLVIIASFLFLGEGNKYVFAETIESKSSTNFVNMLSDKKTYQSKIPIPLYPLYVDTQVATIPSNTPFSLQNPSFKIIDATNQTKLYDEAKKMFETFKQPNEEIERIRMYTILYNNESYRFLHVIGKNNSVAIQEIPTPVQSTTETTPPSSQQSIPTAPVQGNTEAQNQTSSTTSQSILPNTAETTNQKSPQQMSSTALSVQNALEMSTGKTYKTTVSLPLYDLNGNTQISTLPPNASFSLKETKFDPINAMNQKDLYNQGSQIFESFKQQNEGIQRIRMYTILYNNEPYKILHVIGRNNSVAIQEIPTPVQSTTETTPPSSQQSIPTAPVQGSTEAQSQTSSTPTTTLNSQVQEKTFDSKDYYLDLFAPLTSNIYALDCRYAQGLDIADTHHIQGNYQYKQLVRVVQEQESTAEGMLPRPTKALSDYCEKEGGQMVQRIKITTDPKEMIEQYFTPLLTFFYGIFLSVLVASLIYGGAQYIVGSGEASYANATKWIERSMWSLFILMFMQALLAMINPVFFQ